MIDPCPNCGDCETYYEETLSVHYGASGKRRHVEKEIGNVYCENCCRLRPDLMVVGNRVVKRD